MSTVETDWSRVEWILRDWDHDGVVWWGDKSFQDEVNSLRGSFSEENVIDWRGFNIILTTDVIGNGFSDRGDTEWVSVATCTDDLFKIFGSSFGGIWIDGTISDQAWVENTWKDFTVESDGFLFELLWVSDVAEGDFVEWVFYNLGLDYLLFLSVTRFAFKWLMMGRHLELHTELQERWG